MQTNDRPRRGPILMVEDSDEDFAAVQRALRDAPVEFPIYRCTTGEEALEFLHRLGRYADPACSPRPSLILLDLNVPGTDGRAVLKRVKRDEGLKAIPVIILTTSSNPKDVETCYRDGANGYQVKQVNYANFRRAIHMMVDYWFTAAMLPAGTGG